MTIQQREDGNKTGGSKTETDHISICVDREDNSEDLLNGQDLSQSEDHKNIGQSGIVSENVEPLSRNPDSNFSEQKQSRRSRSSFDTTHERNFIDDEIDQSENDGQHSGYPSYAEGVFEDLNLTGFCTRCYTYLAPLAYRIQRFFTGFKGYPKSDFQVSHRLLCRDDAFHQCSGRLHIAQHASGKTRQRILALRGSDWFHVMLSWPTWLLTPIVVLVYTLNLLFFAALYAATDQPGSFCGLTPEKDVGVLFQTAFAFSLITSSTIGYGFPDDSRPFFYDCPSLVVIIYFQVIVSLLINALVVGLVLQRLGRADTRSHQVVFSDKACIRCIHGNFYFMFQVYDLDQGHPVVEAHVRCYAAYHETDGTNTAHFQTRFMRLQNPNDELGSSLFLSLPCTVVHCVDQWSPLMPPEASRSTYENVNDNFVHSSSNRYVFPGIVLREADAESGVRNGVSCPVCGLSFPTDQHLLRHIRYMKWEERLMGAKPSLRRESLARLTSFERGSSSDFPDVPAETRNALAHLLQTRRMNAEDGSALDGGLGSTHSESLETNAEADPSELHYVRSGYPTRVDRMLRYYADLKKPTGHLEVDMNLLPTEVQIVPDRRTNTAIKHHDTNVFSIFGDIDPLKPKSDTISGLEPKQGSKADDKTSNGLPNSSKDVNQEKPVEFNVQEEGRDGDDMPPEYRPKTKSAGEFRRLIEEHVSSSGIEILVLVEGIEARSSNSFQARHSYTFEDIEFDKFFAPSMHVNSKGNAQINLDCFHKMIPVPSYAEQVVAQSHT